MRFYFCRNYRTTSSLPTYSSAVCFCIVAPDAAQGFRAHAQVKCIKEAEEIFKILDKESYSDCLERSGTIYASLGNSSATIEKFSEFHNLAGTLSRSTTIDPANRKRLATSFEKLGDAYAASFLRRFI